MEGTSPYIPITAPFYGSYGNGYGQNDSCVQSQINQLADQVTANDVKGAIRSVGADVTAGTSSVKETVNGVNQNVTNGNYTTLTGLNDLGRDITHTIQREEIAWMNAINASNIATLTGFNNTNAVLASGFNQSFLQSKDIMAQVATGVCDIKTLVKDENSKTRELITANKIQELERKLSDSKNDNSNLRQSEYLLSQLLSCCPKKCPSGSNGNGNGND